MNSFIWFDDYCTNASLCFGPGHAIRYSSSEIQNSSRWSGSQRRRSKSRKAQATTRGNTNTPSHRLIIVQLQCSVVLSLLSKCLPASFSCLWLEVESWFRWFWLLFIIFISSLIYQWLDLRCVGFPSWLLRCSDLHYTHLRFALQVFGFHQVHFYNIAFLRVCVFNFNLY